MLDFRAIADVAHQRGVPVVCDNTVLTPILLRPFDYGVDITVYSATKFIGGHGTSIGGVIVDSGKFDWSREADKWPQFTRPDPSYHGIVFQEAVGPLCYILTCRTNWLRDLGGVLSPSTVSCSCKGLETLHLPDAAAQRKRSGSGPLPRVAPAGDLGQLPGPRLASRTIAWPSGTPQGGRARSWGFGIKGGPRPSGRKFIESVKLASHLANIGDAKTLVIHPGLDNAQPAGARRTGGRRRDRQLYPREHGHRRPGGHQGRLRPGPAGIASVK